ncbi:MAG: hypothetical protein JNN08_21620 [Bryobacterales bacterium]|nr:hypothetical protein [Bryobacterales bacterium]
MQVVRPGLRDDVHLSAGTTAEGSVGVGRDNAELLDGFRGNQIRRGPLVRRTVYVIGKDGKILYSKRGKPSLDEILAAIPEPDQATTTAA